MAVLQQMRPRSLPCHVVVSAFYNERMITGSARSAPTTYPEALRLGALLARIG
jgi:hypothetical protein